ncbi:DUF3795 domain-containing protein [Wukongibacter sp. M2B1]|uniref:DUF3795 domain-containing protein n=1 Tax=Wukongibacter sp. M2B1 TaxID=3088895 RepID=UPI003D79D956
MCKHTDQLDLKYHAKCGLYCPSCRAYIATQEDSAKLDIIANRINMKREDLLCNGCGSEQVSYFCRTCEIKDCVNKKGLLNCSECNEMPCDKITSFQNSSKPHRLEVIKSLNLFKEHGFENWEKEQVSTYVCKECNNINSAYDLSCHKCGNEPGCAFVEKYKQIITKHLATIK